MEIITKDETCPFCECEEVDWEERESTWEGIVQWISCPKCGAKGGSLYVFQDCCWNE